MCSVVVGGRRHAVSKISRAVSMKTMIEDRKRGNIAEEFESRRLSVKGS